MSTPPLAHYLHAPVPLHARANVRILRGFRGHDGTPVVLKIATPGSLDAARLAHEMQILTLVWNADRPCVPRPLELVELDAGLALVTQDEGGTSLAQLKLPTTEISSLLELSEKAARALAMLHQCRVVHKDLNPSNIIFCPETRQVRLIDLGHASELAYERLQNANLEGTPAYMSPEQTGRTQHALDYRTDLYSLGATLYALFADRPPFEQRDLPALFYSILAELPTPLQQLNAHVPSLVEAIVARLMAKSPEERYQSAHGAAQDLAYCRSRVDGGLAVDELQLGRDDPMVRIEVPRRMEGREREVEQLLSAFHRVSHGGQPHLVLVSGPPGIGKSSLLQALQPVLLQQHGLFLAGKHEELQRHVPLVGLRQALTDWVAQLLREPEGTLQVWARRLRAAMSTIGQAIVDIVPDLELVVGKQRALPVLGPREAENRLLTVVQNLMRAICAKQPVVLFLDDMQWSDSSTQRVVQVLSETSQQQGGQLLIVCAFRSSDVDAAHPLWDVARAVEATGKPVARIEVGPLDHDAFERLVAEALHLPQGQVRELAGWLHTKSGGNVFFLRELLSYFWERQTITYRTDTRAFSWDMAVLESSAVPDGVVGLLASNIATLRPEEANLLRIAACMGDTCTLAALGPLVERPIEQVQAWLGAALRMGLLLPLTGSATEAAGSTFQFAHDRVRQAAYEGLDREVAEAIHLRYGTWLRQRFDAGEGRLFAVLQQLNAGLRRIADPAQRRDLAELNLRGAVEAHQAGAHTTALNCLQVATELLPANLETLDFDLFARIQAELADNEYVSGRLGDALERLDRLVAHGGFHDGRALARLHESRGRVFVARAEFDKAIKAAMAGMAALGYRVDLYSRGALLLSMAEMVLRLRLSRFETLSQATECKDPNVALSMALLSLVAESAYHTSTTILMAVAVNICLLTIKHGVTVNSAFGYGTASTYFALISQYDLALRLSSLAQVLRDRPGVTNQAGVTFTCGAWTHHLSKSPTEMTAEHALGYAMGRENGDITYATWNACSAVGMLSYGSLEQCETRCEAYEQFVMQRGNTLQTVFFQAYRQSVRCLLGRTEHPLSFSDASFNEARAWPTDGTGLEPWQRRYILMRQFMVYYLHGDLTQSRATLRILLDLDMLRSLSDSGVLTTCLYGTLLMVAEARSRSATRPQGSDGAYMQRMLTKLRKADAVSSGSGKGPWTLVSAELADLRGAPQRALALYTQALDELDGAGWMDRLGMAQECMARFHLRHRRVALGRALLAQASQTFRTWGAKVKADHLTAELGLSSAPKPQASNIHASAVPQASLDTVTLTQTTLMTQFELGALAQASRDLFEETRPDAALEMAAGRILHMAGATRVVVFTLAGDQLVAQADTSKASGPQQVPWGMIHFVRRSKRLLAVHDIPESDFAEAYFDNTSIRAVACVPLLRNAALMGLIYVENAVSTGALSTEQLALCGLLAMQALVAAESNTLRVQIETELRRRTEGMQQAHRESISRERESTEVQMAGGFAHEMRNALSGARLSLEALLPLDERLRGRTTYDDLSASIRLLNQELAQVAGDDPVRASLSAAIVKLGESLDFMQNLLEAISKGLQRGLAMTEAILAYAQLEQATVEEEGVDLGAVVQDLLTQEQSHLRALDVAVTAALPAGLQLPMPREHVATILRNLVVNAAEATADATPHLPISITAQRTDQQTLVMVRDSGTGMSADAQQRVFQPFFSTKGAHGMGLGLALSRKMARLYGGDVEFSSQPGQGTTFTLRIPRAAATARPH